MSTATVVNSGSPLLRNTIALHAALGLMSLLAATIFVNSADTRILWLLSILMALVLMGGWALQRRLATCIEIDRRLTFLAGCPQVSPQSLKHVSTSDRAATGWNRLVDSACVQRLLDDAQHLITDDHPNDDSIAEHVLSTLSDGICVTDSTGCVLWQNGAVASLLNLDKLNDIDCGLRPFHELFRSFSNLESHRSFLTDHRTVAPMTFELKRGQSTVDGVFRVSRQCLSEAELTCLWTVRDITQQKLSLETRDLFVTAATHELRTPLCNIRAYAETLIAGGDIDPTDERQFLNVILSEASRLDRIIDDLLSISHMQAGSMTLDRHETQIDRLMREVQDSIRPLLDQKSLEFEATIPPRLPELNVDKNKLLAALVNLLGNAIKYTPDGGKIGLEAEHDGHEVRFHVVDTGIGIAPEEIPKLFQRFYRSSDPRVSDIQGTGLGLAFAQDVARLHGGRIDVASELNKGSRFSLILPTALAKLTPA